MEKIEIARCLGCGKNLTYFYKSDDLKWTCEECDFKAKNNINKVKEELKQECNIKLAHKYLKLDGKELLINNNKKITYFFDTKRSEIFFFDK